MLIQVLKEEPQFIALAVDAFYNRDLDAMKAAARMEKFFMCSPGSQTGSQNSSQKGIILVDMMVKFSRAMYAQLVCQNFAAPKGFPLPALSSSDFRASDLGLKVACGMEMMFWERSKHEEPRRGEETQKVEQGEVELSFLASREARHCQRSRLFHENMFQ